MKKLLLQKLERIQQERNIKILYAAESGSRAWGFASPNSDWDVRFIYTHPKEKYLSIKQPEEGINLGVDENELDMVGWELRKMLRLLSSSNASPFEWLQSPMLYHNEDGFKDKIWQLAPAYFKPRAMAFHYLGLTKSSLHKGLVNDKMDIKKYFYILRPLLAAIWICDKQTIPPMEFGLLLPQIANQTVLYEAIQQLTKQKIAAQEGDFIAPVPIIQTFIHQYLEEYQQKAKLLPSENKELAPLDAFFRSQLS